MQPQDLNMSTLRSWEKEEKRWLAAIRAALRSWKGEAPKRVTIYMSSERPMLFVNVRDLSTVTERDRVKVELDPTFLSDLEDESQGFFLAMDLIALKKAVGRFVKDAWSVDRGSSTNAEKLRDQILRQSDYWDDDEGVVPDELVEAALTNSTGARNLAEVIWVYRLAQILTHESPNVAFTAAVHDSFEKTHAGLWKLAAQYREQPLRAYLIHFGLLAP